LDFITATECVYCGIIPPMLHPHFHLHVALTRTANGHAWGDFQILFQKSVSIGHKSTFTESLKSYNIRSNVQQLEAFAFIRSLRTRHATVASGTYSI
jgi:hypothetical protein